MNLKNKLPRPMKSSDGKRYFQTLFLLLLLGGLLIAPGLPRRGQAQEQKKSASPPADSGSLLEEIQDIDMLHSLLPLKLTPEEDTKLADAINTAQADFDKKAKELSAPVLKMADEIHTVHKQGIKGTMSSQDFDDRVKALEKDFISKRDILLAQNILRISASAREIMTPEQVTLAAGLEKKTFQKQGRNRGDDTEEKYFNQYVLDVFINFPRTPALLKSMADASK